MPSIVLVAGAPAADSRTVALCEYLAERLGTQAHEVRVVAVRDLPAGALIGADTGHPAIAEVLAAIAFAGKVVLPVLTGGGPAHALAVDYALRPVLSTLGAHHVVQGAFVLADDIERTPDGVELRDGDRALLEVVDWFSQTLHANAVRLPVP
jgi:FMN reductase